MAMAQTAPRRLNTSQSEGSFSVGSRMSDARREKLMSLKNREDLKDALTEKFKSRFGHDARQRAPDECSVASSVIQREVDQFARSANVTEANLGRLERRLQSRATKGPGEPSVVSGMSAYSVGTQRSRSVASLTGRHVVNSAGNGPESFDWSRLDEYASYLHEQDALRQKMGVQALQRKLRADLDHQVNEKRKKRSDSDEEERRFHNNSMIELERWKMSEQAREEERHQKLMKEKRDRDEQLNFERKLKNEELNKKKEEESFLVEKIVNEMEAEQKRFERKKEQTKKSMRKVFEENMDDQNKRQQAKKDQMEREVTAMREYNRLLDEQEEQRAEELAARMERQTALMKQLQENVAQVQKGAGDNDAQRAAAQQDEIDRHFFEAENMKQGRLKQLRLENQSYLLKQMEEKDMRKEDEKQLQDIQAQILQRDTQEYNEVERQKMMDKKTRSLEHRRDVERQMEQKHLSSIPEMSEAEIAMNKPLLNLVNRTLRTRDENLPPPMEMDEDY